MSLIFGRQVFVTLAEIADAVIKQITLTTADYNTLYGMVQSMQAAAQAKFPNVQFFFVTFSNDPYGAQGGWVRQIAICHNSAGVPTHWDSAIEFPMRKTNGGYYADLTQTPQVVTNVTGSSIGTFTPPAPSDGTSGGTSGSVALGTALTHLDATAMGFGMLAAAQTNDHYWISFLSTWAVSRRFFWTMVNSYQLVLDSGTNTYQFNGWTVSTLTTSYGSNIVTADGVTDLTDDYAAANSAADYH
jgi:hypothetical protein